MSALVTVICPGLLIYWSARTLLLLRAPQEQVDDVLEQDYWWGRRLLFTLRSWIIPPNQFTV